MFACRVARRRSSLFGDHTGQQQLSEYAERNGAKAQMTTRNQLVCHCTAVSHILCWDRTSRSCGKEWCKLFTAFTGIVGKFTRTISSRGLGTRKLSNRKDAEKPDASKQGGLGLGTFRLGGAGGRRTDPNTVCFHLSTHRQTCSIQLDPLSHACVRAACAITVFWRSSCTVTSVCTSCFTHTHSHTFRSSAKPYNCTFRCHCFANVPPGSIPSCWSTDIPARLHRAVPC